MFKVMLVMLLGFVAVTMVFAIKDIPPHQSSAELDVSVERSAKDVWDLETAETANNGGQQHSHGGEPFC